MMATPTTACGPIHDLLNDIYKFKCYQTANKFVMLVFTGASLPPEVSAVLSKITASITADLHVKDQNVLKKHFGDAFEVVLGLNEMNQNCRGIHFIPHTLYHDDSVLVMQNKLLAYGGDYLPNTLNPEQLYFWMHSPIDYDIFVHQMIARLFSDRIYVSLSELSNTFAYQTDKVLKHNIPSHKDAINKEEAIGLLQDHGKVKTVLEPVGFKYVYASSFVYFPINPYGKLVEEYREEPKDIIHEQALLLRSLAPKNNLFMCTSKHWLTQSYEDNKQDNIEDITQRYFPLENKLPKVSLARIAQDDAIIDAVRKWQGTDAFVSTCQPQHVHVQVQDPRELMNPIACEAIFKHLSASTVIPFFKLITPTRTLYKLFKPSFTHTSIKQAMPDSVNIKTKPNLPSITIEDLKQWTKSDKAKYAKHAFEMIVAKVYLGTFNGNVRFATVILNNNRFYDIKFTFRINDNVVLSEVTQYMDLINDALIKPLNVRFGTNLPYIASNSVWNDQHTSLTTKLVRMSTHGTIGTNAKMMTAASLEKACLSLSPFVSVIQTKQNVIHMIYKRIDHFTNQDNVTQYMNKNYLLQREDMITKIMDVFNLSKEQAIAYWQKWAIMNKIETRKVGNKIFYKPKSMHIVSIKLSPVGSGYKYLVEGVKDLTYNRHISHLLLYVVYCATTGKIALTVSKAIKTKESGKVANLVGVDDALEKIQLHDKGEVNMVDVDDDKDSLFDFIFDDLEEDAIDIEKEVFKVDGEIGEVITQSKGNASSSSGKNDEGYETPAAILAMKESGQCPKMIAVEKTVTTKKGVKASAATKKKAARQVGGAKDKETKEKDNEHKVLLNQLYKQDLDLFYFEAPKDGAIKQYAKKCQRSSHRQPVVLTKRELEYNNKCFKDAIRNHVNYGSTPDLAEKNFYICPEVWCPKSRIALTHEQFKQNGSKCPFPGIDEKPIILDGDYWQDKKSKDQLKHFVNFLDPSSHPKHLCMPCCFKKQPTNNNTCTTENQGNEKYIKTESFPVEPRRYGLLPRKLALLLGNKYCGANDGGHGLWTNKTDCYLRYGIPLTHQSFLQSLIALLGNPKIATVEQLCDAIVNHLTVELFITLNDGLVCKKFINNNAFNAFKSEDATEFAQFKKWFLSQTRYIQLYNLDHIRLHILGLNTYNPKHPHAGEIAREYLIYSAFTAFLKYVTDMRLQKTHDIILDLAQRKLDWFNTNGYNIFVFESDDKGDITLACPYHHAVEHVYHRDAPCIMIIKQGAYYEPIYRVKYMPSTVKKNKTGEHDITTVHDLLENPLLMRIYKAFIRTASGGMFDKHAQAIASALQSIGRRITQQVLNYDFQVVGYVSINRDATVQNYEESQMYLPLALPTGIDMSLPTTIGFIDVVLDHFKTGLTKSHITNVLESVNKELKFKYYEIQASTRSFVKLNQPHMIVPMSAWSNDHHPDLYDDAAIFIGKQDVDPRKVFMSEMSLKEKLHLALRNEILRYLFENDKDTLSLMKLMRHSHNPWPKTTKRQLLNDRLKEPVTKLVKDRTGSKLDSVTYKFMDDQQCHTITSLSQCNAQCTWVVSGNKGQCKLAMPSKDVYNMLFEKCIEDFINPTVPLQIVRINDDITYDEKTLLFNDNDVVSGNLERILRAMEQPYKMDHMPRDHIIRDKDIARIDIKSYAASISRYLSDTFENLPVKYQQDMKGFEINSIVDIETDYTANWLFEVYAALHQRLVEEPLSASQLKTVVHDRIAAAFERTGTREKAQAVAWMKSNPSMKNVLETLELEDMCDAGDVRDLLNHSGYYPSELEIHIMSEIVNVNTIIISRQTKRHPVGEPRCFGKKVTPYYVILNHTDHKGSKAHVDLYQIVVKNKTKVIINERDFDEKIRGCLKMKCMSLTGPIDQTRPNNKCPGSSVTAKK
jgi:hypothetical protein